MHRVRDCLQLYDPQAPLPYLRRDFLLHLLCDGGTTIIHFFLHTSPFILHIESMSLTLFCAAGDQGRRSAACLHTMPSEVCALEGSGKEGIRVLCRCLSVSEFFFVILKSCDLSHSLPLFCTVSPGRLQQLPRCDSRFALTEAEVSSDRLLTLFCCRVGDRSAVGAADQRESRDGSGGAGQELVRTILGM